MTALLIAAAVAPRAHAQSGLDAASGKVGILERAGSLGLDLTDTKITLFWVGGDELTTETTRWKQWDVGIAGAAKKAAHSILASGDLNPEFSLSARHAWIHENQGAGYFAIYIAAQAIAANADLFTKVNDTIITSLSSATQTTLFGALGFNLGVTEDHILGFTLRGGRQFNATGSSTTEQVCTRTAAGTIDGKLAEAVDCKQRLKGDPFDRWAGHLRFDGTFKVITPDAADLPTIGLLLATSVTSAQQSKPVFALAAGPTLHPPGLPSTFLAGILAEISDLGNTTVKPFEERFFIRLYGAVPFSIF
jgi:hypothetical protein